MNRMPHKYAAISLTRFNSIWSCHYVRVSSVESAPSNTQPRIIMIIRLHYRLITLLSVELWVSGVFRALWSSQAGRSITSSIKCHSKVKEVLTSIFAKRAFPRASGASLQRHSFSLDSHSRGYNGTWSSNFEELLLSAGHPIHQINGHMIEYCNGDNLLFFLVFFFFSCTLAQSGSKVLWRYIRTASSQNQLSTVVNIISVLLFLNRGKEAQTKRKLSSCKALKRISFRWANLR